MARYRKVYPRLWRNPDFVTLSEGERLLTLYVLTGPQTNRVGLFAFSPGQAAEDLDTSPDTFGKRMANVSKRFDWRFDKATRTLWIPSWWKWNPPENEKVLIGALLDLHEIPETPFLELFRNNTADIPETYRHTLAERIPIRQPYQEQEQEQEQDVHTGGTKAPPTKVEGGTKDEPDPSPEVGRFIKRFCELYSEHRNGAKYVINRTRHVPLVKRLLSDYGFDRLVILAEGLLTTDEAWVDSTDRGISVLHAKANWLNERYMRYEARRRQSAPDAARP